MLKLFKYLKKYKLYAILAPLFMCLEVYCELVQPKLMSDIINVGVANNDMNYILTHGMYMMFYAILGAVGGVLCLVFASKASQNFGADIRRDLFIKTQNFSFSNLDTYKPSTLVTRLTNDITQVQIAVLRSLRTLVRAPLLIFGGIIMAYSINAKLTLVFIVLVPVMVIIIGILAKFSFPLFKTVQEKLDNVNVVMRENLSGVRVIKVFVRDKYEKEKFKKANDDYKETTINAFKKIVVAMPILMVLINFSVVAILYFGGLQVFAGEMLIGDVMAFISYLMQIFMAVMLVAMMFIVFSRAKVSADRINEILELEIDIKDPENPVSAENLKGVVEFKNVSFKYKESQEELTLKNINFKINAGETIVILGETGSGKTSLINLISRLYDATEGEVLIDGVNVKNLKLKELRNMASVVLQEVILFSGSIKDNLKWGKANATEEEIVEACKNACAHDFIMETLEGYETLLGQKGVNLSGGQKQRISIARALIKFPKILILDDSTSAVDVVTEKKIQKALATTLKATTKIIIAQRISSVQYADRVIVLNDGEIVAEGTPDHLIKNSKDYREIYYSQAKRGEE